MLIFRKLTMADEAALKKAMEAFQATPEFTFAFGFDKDMSYADYLKRLEDYEEGRDIADGHVPSTMLFAFEGPECVGRLMIRHQLNEFLVRYGGHIGFAVIPEFRRRGYASEMLRKALPIASTLGIERVLITCDDGNVGSIKTIEACAGKLEDKLFQGVDRPAKRRYWIDLT